MGERVLLLGAVDARHLPLLFVGFVKFFLPLLDIFHGERPLGFVVFFKEGTLGFIPFELPTTRFLVRLTQPPSMIEWNSTSFNGASACRTRKRASWRVVANFQRFASVWD